MTLTDSGVDHVSAPADYSDLFRIYWPYVVALVRRMGIDESHKEDVAAEILFRFMERDFLNVFDPTLVFDYDGQQRPARFKSFLTKFVLSYVRGHWDKQHRRLTREPLICDMAVGGAAGAGESGQSSWVEVFGLPSDAPDEGVVETLGEAALVARLRRYLRGVPRRSKYDTCDLVALFDEMVRQIHARGQWSATALREHFGVSNTAMHAWMWWLRINLAMALDEPAPTKRSRLLP